MVLEAEIILSSDASTLYLQDVSSGYGEVSNGVRSIYKTDIESVTVTFKQYKTDSNGDVSDWISTDKSITIPITLSANTSDLVVSIPVGEVDGSWVTFQDGVYFIQYQVNPSAASLLTRVEPLNNSSYVIGEVFISNLQTYLDNLLLTIANNNEFDLQDEWLFRFTTTFFIKMEALRAAISTGNLKEIRNGIYYLNNLKTSYPSGDDSRRYI